MSSPFKRFGRAFGNFKGGLKQIGSAVLPAGMVQSVQPQRILAHPQTGQLILNGMTIQPEEGMYSVFSMDGVEIPVRYSKILAYTLPQAPSWKDTEMVYVSPKLDALNLDKGASFTVFVGRVHYLVTVIERLAKTLPEYTRPSEEQSSIDDTVIIDRPTAADFSIHHGILEDQTRELQRDYTQILRRKVTAPRTPRMNPAPQNTLPRSPLGSISSPLRPHVDDLGTRLRSSPDPFEPKLSNGKALKQLANLTNTMDETKFAKPTPIFPKTPKYNHLTYGSASSRFPPTPISPLNLKDRISRSKRKTEGLLTTNEMAKESSINTMKLESRKAPPLFKQLPSLPLFEYPPTDLNGEDHTQPASSPQSSRSTSMTSLASIHGTYSSERDHRNYLNHAEGVTSKTHLTDGYWKRTSNRLNTNEGTRSAQLGKRQSKIPTPTQGFVSSSREC